MNPPEFPDSTERSPVVGPGKVWFTRENTALCAPQIRYTTFNQVKKQMFKLHAPHREAGDIVKVEYRETTARDGQPDWEMLYTPGRRQ